MNKGDLIEAVASQLEGTKTDAGKAIDAVLECIASGIRDSDKVTIAGFGTFLKKQRAARTTINPATKEPMQIGPSTTCGFKPAPALKESL